MADDATTPQEDAVAEFRRRLTHLQHSYRIAREVERKSEPLNDSIRRLNVLGSGRRTRSKRTTRLNPYAELAIALEVGEAESGRVAGTSRQARVEAAALRVGDRAKPMRGRPTDRTLEYHVHGLMALVAQHGCPAHAARYENSVYGPRMTSAGGRVVEMVMRDLDPRLTTTALVNIVVVAHRTGVVTDKRFQHFFPFYGGSIDPDTGMPIPGPGFRLESFQRVIPIYCP